MRALAVSRPKLAGGLIFSPLTATAEDTQLCGSFSTMFKASAQKDGKHCYIIKVAKLDGSRGCREESGTIDPIKNELEVFSQLSKLEGASKHCVLPVEGSAISREREQQLISYFEGRSHIVFEYADRQDALSWLQKQVDSSALQNNKHYTEVGSIVHQVHNALVFLHSNGFCHRDIKPENILVGTEGGVLVVKLIDFDCAERIQIRSIAKVRGTPMYRTIDMFSRDLGLEIESTSLWFKYLSNAPTSDFDHFSLFITSIRLFFAIGISEFRKENNYGYISASWLDPASKASIIVEVFEHDFNMMLSRFSEKTDEIRQSFSEQPGVCMFKYLSLWRDKIQREINLAKQHTESPAAQHTESQAASCSGSKRKLPPPCAVPPAVSAAAAAGSSAFGAHKRPKRPTLVVCSETRTSPVTVNDFKGATKPTT